MPRQIVRVGIGAIQELVGRPHLVDEAQRVRLLGEDHAAREQQVHGAAEADEPGQHPRQPVLGGKVELAVRRRELDPLCREPQVAVASEHEPHAGRGPVDRRDNRRAQAEMEREVMVELGAQPETGGRDVCWASRVVAAPFDVAVEGAGIGAGAESPSLAGDHDDPDVVGPFGLFERPAVLGVHPPGPGIEPVGPVEGDGGDPLAHARSESS